MMTTADVSNMVMNENLVYATGFEESTAAANQLERVGYQNLACIVSGLQSLKPGTFESVGKTEIENAGKAGLITVQGKISAVLGTVLICAFLFITFFPEQAEKLLQMSPIS